MARKREQRRREEVEAQVRSALGDFAAAVELRIGAEIDRSRQSQQVLAEAVTSLRDDIANRDAELARALEKLGRVLDRSTECIEDDRHERRALIDALVALAQSVSERAPAAERTSPAASLPRGDRVLGGTIFGSADIELVPDLDVTDGNGNGNGNGAYKRVESASTVAGLEVQCRFGGDWVDGFEVFDVIQDGDDLRYRLRRLSDGSVPSKLFDVDEVRPKHGAPAAEPKVRRTWSRPEWV